MRLEIHDVVTSGDRVVLRFTNSGTTVRDGRITEGWFADDILGMLIQLEAFQTPV